MIFEEMSSLFVDELLSLSTVLFGSSNWKRAGDGPRVDVNPAGA